MIASKKLQVWLPLLFAIVMAAGMLAGYQLEQHSAIPRAGRAGRMGSTQQVIDLVNRRYVDSVGIDTLEEYGIEAIVDQLDPHSAYINALQLREVNEQLQGNFSGIGIEYQIIKDTLHVVYVVENGPSAKAGLQLGDQIIAVDTAIIAGRNLRGEALRKIIRGKVGSKVTLKVMRNGTTLNLPLTRGSVPLPSMEAAFMVEPGIGYIRINKFAETTYKEFMEAATTLQKQGMQKMILDLRGNGGGLLDEATKIADELLVDDKLLVTVKGSRVKTKEVRSSKPGIFEEGPLVLLTDDFSASASEVLAGALQDNDRSTIVGRRTFGKGLVQEQYDLENGGALRLTVARYYTPTGRSIQKPYSADHLQYRNEVAQRFHQANGVSTTADSSSIRSFKTKGGRTVYDGGGITPDILVPADSNQFSAAMMAITSGNTVETATFLWYLKNRARVESLKTADDFYLRMQPDSAVWSSVNKALSNDTVRRDKLSAGEKAAIENRLKAMMARYRWRNNGFYQILLKNDNTFLKGLEAIKSAGK